MTRLPCDLGKRLPTIPVASTGQCWSLAHAVAEERGRRELLLVQVTLAVLAWQDTAGASMCILPAQSIA
jgi:hypothetical protein